MADAVLASNSHLPLCQVPSPPPRIYTLIILARVRHIKCDEEKPICLRCKSVGFTCEGYGYQYTARNAPEVPFLFMSGSSGCRAAVDSRYFRYFRQNALFGLMGFNHQSDFWSRMVLQVSEFFPSCTLRGTCSQHPSRSHIHRR